MTYNKQWYINNKIRLVKKSKTRNKEIISRNKKYVDDIKKSSCCVDCGNNNYIVLDFDHINDKIENISLMVRKCASIKRIQEEINKCEIVCSNCHRIRTYNRRKNRD